jgi:hypothetical protein
MQGVSRWPVGRQLSKRAGEGQDTAFNAGRTAVRRAISGPLTPVTRRLSRSLADTLLRRSGHVTGPDATDSQADSASSILVTRSSRESRGSDPVSVKRAFRSRSGHVTWVPHLVSPGVSGAQRRDLMRINEYRFSRSTAKSPGSRFGCRSLRIGRSRLRSDPMTVWL